MRLGIGHKAPMPRFAANTSLLFTEVPFAERFALAAKCGFAGTECMFPYEMEAGSFGGSHVEHPLGALQRPTG